MDMTQIVLAIVGSISVWTLKSVIELQRGYTELRTEHKAEILAVQNSAVSAREFLEYKLDTLQKSFDSMEKKLDRLIANRNGVSGGHNTINNSFEN